jgi:hypothetical protein
MKEPFYLRSNRRVTELRQAAGRQTTTRPFGPKTQLVSVYLMVK